MARIKNGRKYQEIAAAGGGFTLEEVQVPVCAPVPRQTRARVDADEAPGPAGPVYGRGKDPCLFDARYRRIQERRQDEEECSGDERPRSRRDGPDERPRSRRDGPDERPKGRKSGGRTGAAEPEPREEDGGAARDPEQGDQPDSVFCMELRYSGPFEFPDLTRYLSDPAPLGEASAQGGSVRFTSADMQHYDVVGAPRAGPGAI